MSKEDAVEQFRLSIARQLHTNSRVTRRAIFGLNEKKYKPILNPLDGETMFAGYVGSSYSAGGVVFFGINPGGGGDNYRRNPDDGPFYSMLRAFRECQSSNLLNKFEAVNEAFPPIVQNWNLWRIFKPTLDAFGLRLDQVSYLNAVPYRTRNDKRPPVASQQFAWQNLVAPALNVMQPSALVSLGKAAGSIIERFNEYPAQQYVVPRTNGDTYISPDARQVLDVISAEYGT